jgi:hypothetical protein
MKQYISDIVTIDEIKKWQLGQRILICSQTGTGKSTLIKDSLYTYCKSTNQKILLMSNRILLKKQNEFDIEEKLDVIDLHNYQEFETRILNGIDDIWSLFKPYQYVVFDEGHYFYADSSFNQNTDLLIYPIKNTPKDKILICLTATPDALLDYQPNFDHVYNIPKDYSYIKNIFFYDRNSKISKDSIDIIIDNIPKDEKLLYFGSNVDDIYKLSTQFEDATFICSDGNKLASMSDKNTMLEIEQNAMFSKRMLFATKVLDNGVNIKDKKLKHIIIDTFDSISFIQTLGRKRSISYDDEINLYIKNYHKGQIHYILDGIENKIKVMEDFTKMVLIDFKQKYPDYNFDGMIDENYQINISRYQHYLTQKRLLKNIHDSKYNDAFARNICKLLNKDIRYVKDTFLEFEKLSMKELLEKYMGIKMFYDNQEIFKNMFFKTIFTSKKTNYAARKLNAINKILQEDNLKYNIISRQETNGSNKRKYYWIIERKSYE